MMTAPIPAHARPPLLRHRALQPEARIPQPISPRSSTTSARSATTSPRPSASRPRPYPLISASLGPAPRPYPLISAPICPDFAALRLVSPCASLVATADPKKDPSLRSSGALPSDDDVPVSEPRPSSPEPAAPLLGFGASTNDAAVTLPPDSGPFPVDGAPMADDDASETVTRALTNASLAGSPPQRSAGAPEASSRWRARADRGRARRGLRPS